MKFEKTEKAVPNLHHKTEYFTDITNLKQALNLALVQKKLHIIIKFKQKSWLKSYIDVQ